MGKRSSQKKNAAIMDTDDSDDVSSTSSFRSDNLVTGTEEVLVDRESLLDQCLDSLYEKRATTREKALAAIIEAFNSDLQYEFLEKKFVTLLHQCVNSIKKGAAKEITLAAHTIGLLALTIGPGDKAKEILEESVTPITLALKSGFESSKISKLLECLAIITFVGGTEPDETEKSMQMMWQVVHPKLGSNVAGFKPSPAIVATTVSAWAFLLTTKDDLDLKTWQESVSYFSTLLDKDDRPLRIAAGEALALIFETGNLEKLSAKASNDDSNNGGNGSKEIMHIQGLRSKVVNQVRNLSTEAGGKGSAKKDLNSQRNTFRDVLEFLEDGYPPETSMKIGRETLTTTSWSQLIQLNFLKHFLAGGFIKHMQENEFVQDVLEFIPKKKQGDEHRMTAGDKRLFKSPNSAANKARTQYRNQQRAWSQDRNAGHFAVVLAD